MAMTFNRISKYRTMEISFMVFDTQMVYCTHPRKLVSNLVKALEPFSLSVWLGVFATLVAMSAFFIILNFAVSASDSLALTGQAGVEAVAHDTNHDAGSNHVRNGKQFATFIGLCLMPIALLVEQSHAWVSRFQGANAFRLGLGLYLFGAMVLTFSFKGNLLAALVFLDLEDPLLTSGVNASQMSICFNHIRNFFFNFDFRTSSPLIAMFT